MLVLGCGSLAGAEVYWDTNGATAGSGNASGTWDTGLTSAWSGNAAGTAATAVWSAGDDANFAAGTDLSGSKTITINDTVNVRNIAINEGTLTFAVGTGTPLLQVASGGVWYNNSGNTATVSTNIDLTNALILGGFSQWTLGGTNTTGTGGITIGDGTTFSGNSVGGNVATAANQAAFGSGAYTINYGGTLNSTPVNFVFSNNVTVNAGGKVGIRGGSFTVGTWVLKSLAEITNQTSGDFIGNANVTLPSAGVLFVSSGPGLSFGRPYPSLTGTMAFGGSSFGNTYSTVSAATLSSAAGSARTIAFNQIGGGAFNYQNGLALNANLTVAGTGNTGFTGLVPTGSAGVLGTITQDANRDITLAMAPAGMVSVTGSTTGWRNTALNSGTLLVNTTDGLGAGTFTVNGGTFRLGTGISKAVSVGTSGGVLESANGSTYSGALTGGVAGDADLIIRAVGNTTILSGNNGTFAQGFTLATVGTPSTVRFTTTDNATGSAGNTIVVPSGIAFGFDTTARASAVISKFSTTTDSILYWSSLTADATVNLSSGGLNKDVWIGLGGGANSRLTGYTLPDSGANTSNYRLVPIAASTLSTANLFTGANNLIVSTGAVSTDSNSGATNLFGDAITLTLSAAQNYSGTTTVRGGINNSLMGGGVTGPTLSLATAGELTGTSSITVDKGATLTLTSGSNTGASGVPLTVKGTGTINVNSNSPLRDDLPLTLGGDTGGGTFAAGGYVSAAGGTQTLSSLSIGKGLHRIVPNATGVLTLNNGTGTNVFSRSAGGLVALGNANVTFGGGFDPTGASICQGANGDPILVGAAFLSGAYQPIKAVAGSLVAPTYVDAGAASLWTGGTYPGNNLFNNGTSFHGTLPGGGATINSWRTLSWNPGTLSFTNAADVLTIKSGMIFVDGGTNTPTVGSAGTRGVLTTDGSVTKDLTFLTDSSMTIHSTIGASGAGNSRNLVVAIQTGSRTLALTSPTNSIDDIYALSGIVRADASGAFGDITTAHTFYLMGGTIIFNHALATYSNTNIVVSPVGGYIGTINTVGSGAIIQGNVTLNGTLKVATNSPMSGRVELAGNISGAGDIRMINSYGSNGDYCRLILSGDNSAWSGGLYLNESTSQAGQINCYLGKGSSAGTGPIVVASKGANLYLDTAASSDSTYPNDFIINSPIDLVQWSLGPGLNTNGGTQTTLTGRMVGTSNLTFAGYATGDTAISELVLAGTVSLSGIPASPFSANAIITCNFGTASAVQNLVNGQSGLSLGLTALSVYNGYPAPALPVGVADQGALGFIRFAGTQSFIPGAVGPGFLSAIHRATDTVDQTGRFGFLVTATGGSGTTYQLPEGKSFLIGSLGPADATLNKQIGGTLGASSAAGAGNNFATLLGQAKYTAGQTLAGMSGGDINIHANAATDTQFLKLFVRHAGDTLTLGDGTAANQVVFCPTWGDSGGQSCLTLMRKRTGDTTLTKVGAGTLTVTDADYLHTDGASARSAFTWNVTGGTLCYNDDDAAGANFAGMTIGSGTTLSGSGKINAAVTVTSGTVSPGNAGPAALTMTSLSFNDSSANCTLEMNGDTAGTNYDQIIVPVGGSINLNNASLNAALGYAAALGKVFTIIDNQSVGAVTGTFNGLAEGATIASTGTVRNFTISYVGGDGNDVTLTVASANTAPGQVIQSSPVDIPDVGNDGPNGDDLAGKGRTINPRPRLIWTAPADVNNDRLHFKVGLDTTNGATEVAYSQSDQSTFQYLSGGVWTAFPANGVLSGVVVCYTPPSNLDVNDGVKKGTFWNITANDGSVDGTTSTTRRFIVGTRSWTDDPMIANVTRMKKAHLDELYQEANYARVFRNLAPIAVPAITAGVTHVQAIHFTDLRTGIRDVDTNVTHANVTTWAEVIASGTIIKASHITEMRTALGGL